jgi:hypothetical protein
MSHSTRPSQFKNLCDKLEIRRNATKSREFDSDRLPFTPKTNHGANDDKHSYPQNAEAHNSDATIPQKQPSPGTAALAASCCQRLFFSKPLNTQSYAFENPSHQSAHVSVA